MEAVSTRRDEGVTWLTLDRPEKRNAMNDVLVEALLYRVRAASEDGTKLLVVSASGQVFSAGFDLKAVEDESEGDTLRRLVRIETLLQELYHAPYETLALAEGAALGAGADLFCACRVRVAAPGTRFAMPGTKFGIVLGLRRLMQRVGQTAAAEIVARDSPLDADDACSYGLATAIAAPSEWAQLSETVHRRASAVRAAAAGGLYTALNPDTRDSDMADLVRSASRPGLHERIRAYRDALSAKRDGASEKRG